MLGSLPTAPQQHNVATYDDEIDLVDLMRNIWNQRGLVVGVMVLSLLAVLSFHVSKASFSTAESVEYPVSIPFVNGKSVYPNGAVFNPRDIISSRVLSEVAQENNIGLSALTKAVSVGYSNSLLEKSEEKLAGFLANAKSPADVREATNKVLDDMRAKTRSAATVKLNLRELGVTAAVGERLVHSILATWSKQAIQQGLVNTDVSFPASQFVVNNTNLIDSYEDVSKYSVSLKQAINELMSMPGSRSLTVQEQSLGDLQRKLFSIQNSDINPLRSFAYSNSGALAEQDPSMRIRVASRKRLLSLENDRLVKLIQTYDSTLNQLAKIQDADGAGRSGAASSQGSNAQFDQSFLNSLLELGNKLSNVEIREDLYKRRTKAIEAKLDLEKEIEILKGVEGDTYKNIDVVTMLSEALDNIVQEMNAIQSELALFIQAYREQTLSSDSNLYIADAAPEVRGGGLQVGKKAVLTIVLGAVLGLFLGIIVALLRSAMLNTQKTNL